MSKPKAIFLCNQTAKLPLVYGEKNIERIRQNADISDEVVTYDMFVAGDYSDTEYIFSTWGMPALSEEEIRTRLPKLKAVYYGAGATDYFARPFFACNIPVLSAWQANAVPVAEFTVAQIILSLKGYFRGLNKFTSPEGRKTARGCIGRGAYGETVALIGAGAIATKVQELLKNFDINVIVIPSRAERRTISLEEAFSKAIIVSNHLPNREDNIGVLNGKLFASMREGATFINTGRGAQVNEPEMIEVLKKREDLTALLDVIFPEPPEEGSELYTLPNVFLSAHIAGSENDEWKRMATYMVEEFERHLANQPYRYQVSESMLLTSTK
ncbi:MAG: hydroxyacid dehydrogenase [Lentisphaeria bacterium]|nr:hydroxyacid dehydrogenase [Lentisphaeria bacterium]